MLLPGGMATKMPSFLSFISGGLFKAAGGSVNANQPYIVGEHRPELFVPKTAGTILPSVPGMSSVDNSRWELHFHDADSRGKMVGLSDEKFAEQFKRAVRDRKIDIRKIA
jgi:hypothetical protein